VVRALIFRDGGVPSTSSQFPVFLYRPKLPDKNAVKRWNDQVKGVKRVRVIALAKRSQPYRRGKRRFNHWLAILKDLNNRDKHHSLVLHALTPDQRLAVHTTSGDLAAMSWGPDDGTEPTTDYFFPTGELVRVVKVERYLVARITLDQWGQSGQIVDVVSAFREGFLPGVTAIVDSFEPFLVRRR
jgi:hypothetical protein